MKSYQITGAILVGSVIIGGAIYFGLIKSKGSINKIEMPKKIERIPEKSVETYTATVVQVGGGGSRLVTKTAWYFPETTGQEYLDAEEYALVDFNRGEDIMSLSCQEGYQITSCESPSGKGILNESGYPFGCRILLEEKLKNEILINCSK